MLGKPVDGRVVLVLDHLDSPGDFVLSYLINDELETSHFCILAAKESLPYHVTVAKKLGLANFRPAISQNRLVSVATMESLLQHCSGNPGSVAIIDDVGVWLAMGMSVASWAGMMRKIISCTKRLFVLAHADAIPERLLAWLRHQSNVEIKVGPLSGSGYTRDVHGSITFASPETGSSDTYLYRITDLRGAVLLHRGTLQPVIR